eukprot:jgi/Tetstr1/449372/TSEL_003883.t1
MVGKRAEERRPALSQLLVVVLTLWGSVEVAAETGPAATSAWQRASPPSQPDLPPKYHLYDPNSLTAYTKCRPPTDGYLKHNVDALFVAQLLREHGSVPPEEADVFVVPALLSQAARGRCGNHRTLYMGLRAFLGASPWFQRSNGTDHFLVRGHFAPGMPGLPGQIVIGRFEANPHLLNTWPGHPIISVGYSTAMGMKTFVAAQAGADDAQLAALSARRIKPFPDRTYDFSFVGQADTRAAYLHRRQLGCSMLLGPAANTSRGLVHLSTKHGAINCGRANTALLPRIKTDLDVLADSRFVVTLTGDTPTTDRLCNMFDTVTVPIALASKLPAIMSVVPFREVIPWQEIFATVSDAAWKVDAVQSVLDVIDSLTPAEVQRREHLMMQHADDISFASPATTRAHTNLINAAWAAMQPQLAKKGP